MTHDDKSTDAPNDPTTERELAAIDAALAGRDVDPDLAEVAELTEAIREVRPVLDDETRRRLDLRAAATASEANGSTFSARVRELLRTGPSYKALAPAGVAATLLVAVAVGVSQIGGSSGDDTPPPVPTAVSEEAAGGSAGEGAAAKADQGFVEPNPPELTDGSREFDRASGAEAAPEAALVDPAGGADAVGYPVERLSGNKLGSAKRHQDRDANLTLSTEPDEVRRVADEAVDVTHEFGGQVLSLQVSEQKDFGASASMQLELPTAQLDGALDALSGLASVESINETALDITKAFDTQRQQLADARAEREALLKRLSEATDATEIERLKDLLADARRRIANQRADFQRVARQANVAQVNLSVVGNGEGEKADDGSWGIDDAIDDALSVLRSIGGALIVALAAVIPLGLITAAIWWAAAGWSRSRRERALDNSAK